MDVLDGPVPELVTVPVQVIITLPLNGTPVDVLTVSCICVRVLCGCATSAVNMKMEMYERSLCCKCNIVASDVTE
jgi:hypothetical protein